LQNNFRRVFYIFLGVLFLLFILAVAGARFYTDWLWFQSLGYQRVFLTIIFSDVGLRFGVGAAFFILLFVNLMFTRGHLLKAAQKSTVFKEDDLLTIQSSPWSRFLTNRLLIAAFAALSLIMAFLFSFSVAGDWVTLQKFLHPTSFGVSEPVFNLDLGFYVFRLPFYLFLYQVASAALLVIAFWTAIAYFLVNLTQGTAGGLFQSMAARYHLSGLAALFFLLKAIGYQLERYALLFTHSGAVWGPGYTATHATLPAYNILTVIALVCALAIIINIFLRRFRLVVYSIGVLLVASVLLGGVYPGMIQKFRVQPNEIVMEKPYLERNIQFTRLAYKLDSVEKKDFPAGRVLAAEDIRNNQDTIENIRLWDWEPLQQTYSQLQEMRPYYQFKDIDVDRYIINGRYRQVMLAARELNQEHLQPQAKTWVNQRLSYTHGYGIAMSPVNEFTGEGLPTFFLKDIPPVANTDLKVDRPEIYYGEKTDQYVIVNTSAQEFDYPMGEENVYADYTGESGVQISNILRRLMFTFALGDYKLLLASDIDNNSRVLYYRNIQERIPKIAPFLSYDEDPYVVLSGGRLFWIWDAYTTTDKFPYSEPFNNVHNYIRNAVKVVVDAYTGKVDFYISDPGDPLAQTYSKIFPGMFKNLDEMPADLRLHVRYPVDYFTIQAQMYASYHMEDPQVFYNREDKWNLPTEIYASETRPMEAYYTIIKLPGQSEPEFVLILPFTPQNKNNMIAWLAARSDGENYGKLMAYYFPKQELVYGPMQVEARINQDTTISQQLSLWDQRGSNVIRGNLLAIPIKDALIYVEPLYLQAEQSRMPELRRVIVTHGERVVMEPSLELALTRIFGEGVSPEVQEPAGEPGAPEPPQTAASVRELAQRANQLYDEAQERLKAGDWSGYGDSLAQLKQTLTELAGQAVE
jgi:uncharacterized membrane protein (UPF0182 family)